MACSSTTLKYSSAVSAENPATYILMYCSASYQRVSLALKWRLGSTGKWPIVAPTNQNKQRQSNEPIINIINMTGAERGKTGGGKAPLVLT